MMLFFLWHDKERRYYMDMHTLIAFVASIKLPVIVQRASASNGFADCGQPCLVTIDEDGDFIFECNGVRTEHNLLDVKYDDAWRILSVVYPKAEAPIEPLQATKDLPTVPGTYWVWGRRSTMKGAKHFTLRTVNLEMHNGFMRVADNMTCGLTKGLPLAELKGMSFAGPIPTPVGVI